MKVRIKATPQEPELDGLKLDNLIPGTVRDVSPIIASWLIAEGYADLEMRLMPDGERDDVIALQDRRAKRR